MFALEKNGPIVAQHMRTVAGSPHNPKFVVVSLHHGSAWRHWTHGTLKAAFRRLGSVADSAKGKLYKRDCYAAAVVTPEGRVMNWQEIKEALSAA